MKKIFTIILLLTLTIEMYAKNTKEITFVFEKSYLAEDYRDKVEAMYLGCSENNFKFKELPMEKIGDKWLKSIKVEYPKVITYKYVIKFKGIKEELWIHDPGHMYHKINQFGNLNSFLKLDKSGKQKVKNNYPIIVKDNNLTYYFQKKSTPEMISYVTNTGQPAYEKIKDLLELEEDKQITVIINPVKEGNLSWELPHVDRIIFNFNPDYLKNNPGILEHEIVHLMLMSHNKVLDEGLGEYFQTKYFIRLPYNYPVLMKAMLDTGKKMDISTLWTQDEYFWWHKDWNRAWDSYKISGAFIEYILDQYGLAKYKDLHNTHDCKTSLGISLQELEKDWKKTITEAKWSENDTLVLEYYTLSFKITQRLFSIKDNEKAQQEWTSYMKQRRSMDVLFIRKEKNLWITDQKTFKKELEKFRKLL